MDDTGKTMEGLIANVGFFNLPGSYPPQGPDRFQYTIEVSDEEQHHTVSYSDDNGAVPSELRTLTELMTQ